MLYLTYTLDILILLAIPIVLGIILVRRFDLEGRWWWIGAMVYIVSQVILQPWQNYVLNPFLNNLKFLRKIPFHRSAYIWRSGTWIECGHGRGTSSLWNVPLVGEGCPFL